MEYWEPFWTLLVAEPVGADPGQTSLGELAWVFLRLGATSFGGPAAHVALMEDECVHRRGWLSRDEFLDLLGATQLIPGPNSTEMAIHIGYRRRGFPGLVVAGACFIVPAFLIVLALAWVYVTYRTLPSLQAVLYCVKPVMLAVVLQALVRLAPAALKDRVLIALALVVAVANFLAGYELLLLVASGLFVCLLRRRRLPPAAPMLMVAPPLLAQATATPFSQGLLFLFFLKVGSILYGSGYVLLAFLRADLVDNYGWLTEDELLDAVAIGQVTPGPVFTTATFVGFVVASREGMGQATLGAVLATLGIFLPAFVFVALSGPLVRRLRSSPTAGAFLDGVNAASLALMAAVLLRLGLSTLVDVPRVLLALAAAALLLTTRVNSAWLMLGAAALGLAASLAGGHLSTQRYLCPPLLPRPGPRGTQDTHPK